MRKGQLAPQKKGFLEYFVMFFIGFMFLGIPFIYWGIQYLAKPKNSSKKAQKMPLNPTTENTLILSTSRGYLHINNPFRGIFIVGSAGSGKSESLAVPLLEQFIKKGYSGVIYDFKFPTLANDAFSFYINHKPNINFHYLDFDMPIKSHRCNPLNPQYMPSVLYAREYASAIVNNLMKESIKKPDFWTRSATDLLTAVIWYMKLEHPDKCDLPHVFAMITSNDEYLLKTLQRNPQTAQMTVSIFNAMERGAQSQVAGVIGTLQGAISQINTPELMYIFGADDFSLDINNPSNPILLTVSNNPTLSNTLAPLCSLVITVATKLMNQPNKHKSFVLLDEAPTCYIPNLEMLPNTGRSNKIATVIMCQDIAQLTDGYGKEKSDVLFASCNNHFYGRVGSTLTADIISRQFGKQNEVYVSRSRNSEGKNSYSETMVEREIIKASEVLQFQVGEFAGLVVEGIGWNFRDYFHPIKRSFTLNIRSSEVKEIDFNIYYNQVRLDVNLILRLTPEESKSEPIENKYEL